MANYEIITTTTNNNNNNNNNSNVRSKVVGIATRYGLNCQGFEPRWGRKCAYPTRPTPRPNQPPVEWAPGTWAGMWLGPPIPI